MESTDIASAGGGAGRVRPVWPVVIATTRPPPRICIGTFIVDLLTEFFEVIAGRSRLTGEGSHAHSFSPGPRRHRPGVDRRPSPGAPTRRARRVPRGHRVLARRDPSPADAGDEVPHGRLEADPLRLPRHRGAHRGDGAAAAAVLRGLRTGFAREAVLPRDGCGHSRGVGTDGVSRVGVRRRSVTRRPGNALLLGAVVLAAACTASSKPAAGPTGPDRAALAARVKEEFLFSWRAYERYAW